MPSLLEQELARQSVNVQSIQPRRLNKKGPGLRRIVSKLRVLDAVVKRIVKRETEDAGNIDPTTPQGTLNEKAWIMSYTNIEKVLLAMLKLYNIDIDAGYDDTGNHRFHISEFDNADNPFHGIFGCVRVEEAGNPTSQVPRFREAVDGLRRWRNWARFPSSAKPNKPVNDEETFTYAGYYATIYQGLVECRSVCMKDAEKVQLRTKTKPGFVCEDADCGSQFASHKKLKRHVKSRHSDQLLPPNPTQVQDAEAGIHEAQIQVVAPAEEAQEDKTPPLSSHRLRDSHEARKAKSKLSREQQHSATSVVSLQPYSLSRIPPPWSSDCAKKASGASPASKQDEDPKDLPIDISSSLTKLGSATWSQSLSGRLPMLEWQDTESGDVVVSGQGDESPNELHDTFRQSMSEKLAMLERHDAESAGGMFSQRISARLAILERQEEGFNHAAFGTKSSNHLHDEAQASESDKTSDHHDKQLQELRLGIQGMLTGYEGVQSQRIATFEQENARMRDVIVLSVDALAKAQTAHDDVLCKQAEVKEEVEAVAKERDELKEQLAQAGEEQAALVAQAKIEGAEEMFRRISGAGEWLLLSFKGKIGEQEKAQQAIS